MQCFMLISYLYIWKKFNTEHPYYYETLNTIRSGSLMMIILSSIISLLANFFNINATVIAIITIIASIVGFIFGIYICKKLYKKKVSNIFKKLKEKSLLYIKLENEYINPNSESSEDSNNEEKFDSSSNSEEEEEDDNDDGDDDEEEEEEEESNSVSSSSINSEVTQSNNEKTTEKTIFFSEETLSKIDIKKDIFNSINEIVNKYEIKEQIIVFKSPKQIELICRFLRNNISMEAYQLLTSIYVEGFSQYYSNALIHIYYSYYYWYIERYYKDENNYHENYKLDVELLLKSEISSNSLSFTEIADGIKRNFLLKYYVNFLVRLMVDKQRDNTENENKEVLNKYNKYQNNAVENHISSLYILKVFFKKINQNLDNNVSAILKEVDISSFLELLMTSKSNTEKHYKFLITNFPNEKKTYLLYSTFLNIITNNYDMANKYSQYCEINSTFDINNDYKKNKSSINSLNKSEGTSTAGEKNGRKISVLKKNLNTLFMKESKIIFKIIYFLFILILIGYLVMSNCCHVYLRKLQEEISLMDGLLNVDYIATKLSRSIRLLSLYMMNDDFENVNKIKEDIITNQLPLIQEKIIPYLKRDQATEASTYPVFISSLDDDVNRGMNFYMNGYELYKKMDTFARFFINLNDDDWYNICFYDENKIQNNNERSYLNEMKDEKIQYNKENDKIVKYCYNNDSENHKNCTLQNSFNINTIQLSSYDKCIDDTVINYKEEIFDDNDTMCYEESTLKYMDNHCIRDDTPINFENNYNNYNFKEQNIKDYVFNILEESKDRINNKIDLIKKVFYIIIIVSALFCIVISFFLNMFCLITLLDERTNIQKKTLRLFKTISKSVFEDLHDLYKKNIKIIADSTNVNPEIFQKEIKKKVGMILEKSGKPRYNNTKAYICNLFMITSIVSFLVPFIICNNYIEDSISYAVNISDRKKMIEEINLYTMETVFQDRNIYPPGDSEIKLKFVLNKLKNLQNDIFYGNIGCKPIFKMNIFKEFMTKSSCKIDNSCDSITVNSRIGFNANVGSMNIDQLITEYITNSNIFYRETEVKQQFNQQNLYKEELNKNNIKETLAKYHNNDIINYQNLAIPQIQKGLSQIEDLLNADIDKNMEKSFNFVYVLRITSFILILFSLYITYKTIIKIVNDTSELVNVIFSLYLNSNTPIPDFKENN
ncbi:hypothetical protein BCR36DRAFT_408745 [Piromyces finnis]|uniref:Uncharacterized protein n=1 Tax=Piromyces finnis TaxID=1754191 RepID=A0A1Y1VL92_9FUNG|nr:hypothetical protein BCR36DRAFT_408745 [Piromyces finnis]|eukprot:ORX59239.1 hypothetical protein BCR36DRAFT_408745 [Piromyces finnis]